MIPQSHLYKDEEMAGNEPNMASYRQNQPGFRWLDDTMHQPSHSMRSEPSFLPSHGIYYPEYTPNQGLSFPRGRSVINHHSDFEQVKHVAPRAPSQPDLVHLNPHGHNKPPQFVQNGHDLVVDEFVPNRRGMSLSGPPLPQSRGRATHQRGHGPGRGVPVLGSAVFANKERGREMNRGPVVSKLKKTRIPGRFSRLRRRRINPKQFRGKRPE